MSEPVLLPAVHDRPRAPLGDPRGAADETRGGIIAAPGGRTTTSPAAMRIAGRRLGSDEPGGTTPGGRIRHPSGRLARRLLRVVACHALPLLAVASGLWSAPLAGETTFSVDAAAVQSFLRAVTPYDVSVGKGDLNEVLTLANPRNVRFQDGKVWLTLDCRGQPVPIEMVLTLAIGLKWDEESKAWMAYLASLPLEIPLFGKFDLAKYVDPYPIPQTFSQPAGNDEAPFSIDGLLKSLRILDDRILVEADLTFRTLRPPEVIRPEPSPAAQR
jgi:hypothetical protein